MNTLKFVYRLFDSKIRFSFFANQLFLLFSTILEVLSIGLLLPIINLILNKKEYINLNEIFGKNFDFIFNSKQLILLFLFIFLIKNLFIVFLNFRLNFFIRDIRLFLSKKLISGYLGMSLSSFKKENTPELNRNLVIQISNFSEIIKTYLQLSTEILIILSILFFLYLYDPYITLLLILIFLTFSIFYLFFCRKFLSKLGNDNAHYSKQILKDIEICFLNFKLIKIRNLAEKIEKNFIAKNLKFVNSAALFNFIQSLTRLWLEIIIVIFFSIVFFFMSSKESLIVLDVVKISFFFIASIKIMPSINKIVNFIQKLKFSKITIKIIYDLTNKFKKNIIIKNSKNAYKKEKKVYEKINNKNIQIKSISFKYNSKYILKNYTTTIENNKIYLITGPSGTGKTTFVELLIGLITPFDGTIYIGNKQINNVLRCWQEKIAYVSQNSYLIEDTIKNNIIFNEDKNQFNEKKYNEAVIASGLNTLFDKKLWNDQMSIGQNGINISGGQAQRIGIARALYQEFDMMIFDETFNSIDYKSILIIINNIKKIYKNKKFLIISHNKFFKKIVDKIIFSKEFLNFNRNK